MQKKGIRILRELTTVTTIVALMAVTAGTGTASAAIQNPLDGIAPDFTLFGALDAPWKRFVAFLWAVLLCGASVRVLVGAYKVKRAKTNGYGGEMADGGDELKDALISLGCLALATPLIGAILVVAG